MRNAETPSPSAEAGFTMIEVLVTAFVLVVGLLAIVGLVSGAIATSATNNQRIGATNLARELAETSRALDYDDLRPSALVSRLQARGLGSGTPWTISRRGVAYTVSASVCTFDDTADRLASTPPSNVCTPQPPAPAGTPDKNGDDFRRVTFTLSWDDRGRNRSLTQSSLIVNPSGGLGPRIESIAPLTQTVTTNVSVVPTITVTTPSGAAAVNWHVDNGKTSETANGGPGTWTIDWAIGTSGSGTEVLDGSYQIIAQAFDALGVAGDSKIASVVIDRRRPYAPPALIGGHVTRDGAWMDFEWELNSERDITGYRVYWTGADGVPGGGDDVRVCPEPGATKPELANDITSCVVGDPPDAGAGAYYVVALDTTAEGDRRLFPVTAPDQRPDAPTNLTSSTDSHGKPRLTWDASATGGVRFYRIYRNGTALADRVERTAPGATDWSDSKPPSGTNEYWVTAVGEDLNESDPIGPVSWP